LHILATPAELFRGGAGFLTPAFRAWGSLSQDETVCTITEFTEFDGGSTGRKARLTVDYSPGTRAPRELFVKFSRDLDTPERDHGRTQMASEVLFAHLCRVPGFPVPVPRPMFAAYDVESGTGILISERISYGHNGIEPAYQKCADHTLPDPLAHYRAMLTAVARLAGTDRAGLLPADLVDRLRPDMRQMSVGERVAPTPQRLSRRIATFAEFAADHPALLPANLRSPAFLTRMATELPGLHEREDAAWRELDNPELVALCHWNANVDNAWFWREAGVLHCGLMDWGAVGRMNIAMAIWGSLCSAQTWMWDRHLDELLEMFVTEFAAAGGPLVEIDLLRRHVLLYAAVMGITWLLDVPQHVLSQVPGLPATTTPHDPAITAIESVRCRLQMMTNLLNLWDTHDVGGLFATLS
jgi:hypothetical protein